MKRIIRAVAIILMLSVLMTGCGTKDKESDKSGDGAVATPSVTQAPTVSATPELTVSPTPTPTTAPTPSITTAPTPTMTPTAAPAEKAQYVMPDVRGVYYADAVKMIEVGLEQAGFTDYRVGYFWSWRNYDPAMNACILSSNPPAGTVIVDNGETVSIELEAAEWAPVPTEPEVTGPEKTEPEKVLVVYFSATGNTKAVAEMIAKIENADLYEIVPAEPYTEEDLDYTNTQCRALREQNDDSARPEIASEPVELQDYTKIYVGYPIWAGKEPRIMDTFVEDYKIGTMIEIIPFCTSGSSGIGSTGHNLATLASFGDWKDGKRFSAEEDIRKWIEELK